GPYDVIHSHVLYFSGYVLKIAKKHDIPVRIAHSHSTQDKKRNSIIRKIYRIYMTHKIRTYSTKMIGCSKAACESVFRVSPKPGTKVEYFTNAISLKPYVALRRKKPTLLKELNLNDDGPIIGHIGRFTESKNHKFIVEVFERFLLRSPN